MSNVKRIIFIDDDPDILEVYRELLGDLPYEILYFNSPKKALAYSKEAHIDMVICDEQMHELSGLLVLKELRTQAINNNAHFYLVTGHYLPAENAHFEEGCKRIIQKPFEVEDIIAMINEDLKT